MQDRELISAYTWEASEEAFAELVERHLPLVYSAALRCAGGEAPLAEEATQRTFLLLAQKSSTLPPDASIPGWLYQTACNVARQLARGERRRRFHERQALEMEQHTSSSQNPPAGEWEAISLQLDEAIQALPEKDRAAILLRFFAGKRIRDVAAELGVSEDAAKMRLSRAVEKLRGFLSCRGVGVSAASLSAMLAQSAVQALPAALAAALKASITLQLGTAAAAPIKTVFLMSNLQKIGAAAPLLLLTAGLGLGISQWRGKTAPLSPAGLDPSSAAAPRAAESFAPVAPLPFAAPEDLLASAIAGLRRALTDPWDSRKPPRARIEQAIDAFGSSRAAAVPTLLDTLDPLRSLETFALAAYGLEYLGRDAGAAIPDLLRLTRSGKLNLLNESVPRLLSAVSPDGGILPDLVDIMGEDNVVKEWIGRTIVSLVTSNPHLESVHRPRLAGLLSSPNISTRRSAAAVLARLPGVKERAAIPVLLEALTFEKLRDPASYPAERIIEAGGMALKQDLRWADTVARVQAAQALGEFGPAAQEAILPLLDLAAFAGEDAQLREFALEAVGKISPEWRAESPLIADTISRRERGWELAAKAKNRQASLEELIEALGHRSASYHAADALQRFGDAARPAVPALLRAITEFEDDEAARRLKDLAPELLIEHVRAGRLDVLQPVAEALAELGPGATEALPHLEALLLGLTGDDSGKIHSVAEAITAINPSAPKMLFDSADLLDATSAFLEGVHKLGKHQSPAYQAFLADFQDQNNVPRPRLLKFIQATRSDPDLHHLFTAKLLEKFPDLSADFR